MRFLLTILTIWLTSIIAVGDTIETAPEGIVAIDMRHGLPESRIRALQVLPDRRVAVATAGYLSIFDGTRFINIPIEADKGIVLASRGKKRKLFHDRNGILWLKTSVSRTSDRGRLHAFDPISGKDITEDAMALLGKGEVCDFFVDAKGAILIIDAENNLCTVEDKERRAVINIGAVANELPSAIYGDGDRTYLCYDNGNVCVINLRTRLLESISRAPLPEMKSRIINGIARCRNGKIWIPYRRHNDNGTSWMASLDTATCDWNVRQLDRMIYDFIVDDKDSLIYSFPDQDDEIFCIEQDGRGGIWTGTGGSGLRHIISGDKRLITLHKGTYPYPANGYFPDEKAKGIADKYAPGILNCSAADPATGYTYLGTRKGLMVVNREGSLIGILDNNVGLTQNNVQSVVANVRCGKEGVDDGEVWFTTTTGISRLRHLPGDTLEVINLGILDGLDLNGKEFNTQSITVDSLGNIVAGYSGGWCSINPAAIDNERYVVYRYPDSKENAWGKEDSIAGIKSSVFLICLCGLIIIISLCVVIPIYRNRRRRCIVTSGDTDNDEIDDPGLTVSSSEKEKGQWSDNLVERLRETAKPNHAESGSQDAEFLTKVNTLIENHIDDETLSVVSLSSMMAMDRTNLYRKMQTVTGKSPSAYIKDMRLSVAARLLKETDLSIHDIASRTGFSSSKYFSASFKDRFGMLPGRYRGS